MTYASNDNDRKPLHVPEVERHKGERFEATKDLTTAAVARLVRAELKAMVRDGRLPRGVYRVLSEEMATASAINVIIGPLEGVRLLAPGWRRETFSPFDARWDGAWGESFTEAYRAVRAKVEALLGSFNRTESEAQSDYFNDHFYANADTNQDWLAASRDWVAYNDNATAPGEGGLS
jgi:hypothetical protein